METTYEHIRPTQEFEIKDEFNSARLMRLDNGKSLCIRSEYGSYLKGEKHTILNDQKVKITSR